MSEDELREWVWHDDRPPPAATPAQLRAAVARLLREVDRLRTDVTWYYEGLANFDPEER